MGFFDKLIFSILAEFEGGAISENANFRYLSGKTGRWKNACMVKVSLIQLTLMGSLNLVESQRI